MSTKTEPSEKPIDCTVPLLRENGNIPRITPRLSDVEFIDDTSEESATHLTNPFDFNEKPKDSELNDAPDGRYITQPPRFPKIIEQDNVGFNHEPPGGSEVDVFDEKPVIQPGVDDGFYTPDNTPPVKPPNALVPSDVPRRYPSWPGDRPVSPMDPYPFVPNNPGWFGYGDKVPDVNVYQQKKILAQGMMDLALLSANANQLRYVLEMHTNHPYYYPSLVLISSSLVIQICVGVGLIWNSMYNVKKEREMCIANRINNFVVIGIFLVTIINVFISAFGISTL